MATVVAEIAHIRSEIPGGPRPDPDYTGDVNGPDNLLLLCGKHHRAVDRHESVYRIEELKAWKLAQRAGAGGGTPLTDADLCSYQRLSDEERRSLKDVARLAQRVTSVCKSVQTEVDRLRAVADQVRRQRAASFSPMYAVDDDGNETLIDSLATFQLSAVERREWQAKELEAWEAREPQVNDALVELEGEVAVLRMFDHTLTAAAATVVEAATALGTAPTSVDSLGGWSGR